MQLFVRAVITGFGLALGAAIFRKLARELGIDDDADKPVDPIPQTPAREA